MSHSDRLPQFDSEEPTEDELIRLEEQSLQAIKKYSDRIPSIPPDPLETQREKIREKAAQILLIIQMNGVEDQLSAHDVLGFDVSLFPHEDRGQIVQLRTEIHSSQTPLVDEILSEMVFTQLPLSQGK